MKESDTTYQRVKIGSKETSAKIVEKHGLKFLFLGDNSGVQIRFCGKTVGYVSSYYLDWLSSATVKEIYQELLSQASTGRCSFAGDNLNAYKDHLDKCIGNKKRLNPVEFQKTIDKRKLMEALQ